MEEGAPEARKIGKYYNVLVKIKTSEITKTLNELFLAISMVLKQKFPYMSRIVRKEFKNKVETLRKFHLHLIKSNVKNNR